MRTRFFSKRTLYSALALCLIGCGDKEALNIEAQAEKPKQPNILLIVADDLGYSDIGSFGGEIKTPTLDALAQAGTKFSNFHVLPTCSPTRSVLLSGMDNHLAGLGTMAEIKQASMESNAGYAGYLNFEVAALPEVLKSGGYRTYMSGKWHLGNTKETMPYARGFDETFALLPGGGSHWNDMSPLSPAFPVQYTRNGQLVESLPEDFYSTQVFTEILLNWMKRDQQDEKPFFAYLSYSAPHDPLHAPAEYIAKYKGMYDGGWDNLRAQRFERLKELGIVKDGVKPSPRMRMVKAWDTLSVEEKAIAARNMEVYAAMVDYMDEQIKRVIDHLVASGEYDNTLILFFSDNGANGMDGRVMPGMTKEFKESFDNSLANLGLPNSFTHTGAGWAQASMAPSRLMKGLPAEGGIKSPMLVKVPKSAEATLVNKGMMNTSFFHVRDIMPTLLDIANITPTATFEGRKVRTMQGQSVLDLFTGKVDKPYEGADKVGYELLGFKAYIDGDWKILNMPKPFGKGDWELFNMQDDPAEINDLSDKNPDKRQELIEQWLQYQKENNVLDISTAPAGMSTR